MYTQNLGHPVHDPRTHVAAQCTGTASIADALARATRLVADLNTALVDGAGNADATADRLRALLTDATSRAAQQADLIGERYQDGWIATRRLTHEVATVVRDLDAVADLVRLSYRVAGLPVDVLVVGALAEGLSRTLTFRAERDAKAERKAAKAAKAAAKAGAW